MKWPEYLILIRHGKSQYNALKEVKRQSKIYQQFLAAYASAEKIGDWKYAAQLAEEANAALALEVSDWDTPLVEEARRQTHEMTTALRPIIDVPHVIFVSPYKRTWATLGLMWEKWPELANVKTIEEDRIREKEHGHAILYNDWKIYFALHPEERQYSEKVGEYMFAFPRGENIPRVRERNRSWITTLIREYAGKRVVAITHHVNILALRTNLERLGRDEYMRLDTEEKPINCGVTIYRGDPTQGENGKLVLAAYNLKLHS